MFSFDIDKYLNRIGIDMAASDLHVTGESLCLLQKAHLYCVPYENFDIIDGIYDEKFSEVCGILKLSA